MPLTEEERKAKKAEQNRRYREANKEKLAEYQRQYYEANKEKAAEQGRRYREANKESIAERDRRYREANKERIDERVRQWHEANPERVAKNHALSAWKRSGVIVGDYDALYQHYLSVANCEDCGVEFAGKKGDGRGKYRCLDHDHDTGAFRAIVCNACNVRRGYKDRVVQKSTE